jgi:hypothetical protein
MNRVAFGLVALVAACGGSTMSGDNGNASATCGVAPCGGDVVGKWNVLSDCGPSTYQQAIAGCAEPLTIQRSGATVSGTFEYRTDGTYSASMTMSGTTQTTYPASCLTFGTYTVTCDEIQLGGMTDAGIASHTCTATATRGCTCTTVISGYTQSSAGTYSTNGTILTQGTGTDAPGRNDYCVQGNRLTEVARATANDAGVTYAGGTGVVLEKLP